MKDWVFRNRLGLVRALYIVLICGVLVLLVAWQNAGKTTTDSVFAEVCIGDPYTQEFLEIEIPEDLDFFVSSSENSEVMISLGLYSEDESGEFAEVGFVGIDSGTCGIFSEKYGEFYVTSGYGDGVYPVFVRTGENGVVNAVEVRFV